MAPPGAQYAIGCIRGGSPARLAELPFCGMRIERTHVAAAQGALFLASGLWPVVHLKSFEAATGPKREGWLVKALGLVLASVGAGLVLAAARREVSGETALVGALSSTALAAINLRYAGTHRISRVYFIDALLHACSLAGWLAATRLRWPLKESVERWRPLLAQ